jgi:two-component system sensor histidine kinase QseC
MKSIRASLVAGSVIGTVAVFTLSGITIYRGAKSTLVRQLDENLADQVRVIASVVKQTPDGMEVEVEDIDLPEFTSPAGHGYLQVWLEADRVLYRSPRLDDASLDASPGLALDRPAFAWKRVGGSVRARGIELHTHAVVDPEDWEEVHEALPAASVIHIAAAMETRDIDTFLARLRTLLIAVGGLGGLVVATVLAAVIRNGLRPLDNLAREIANLKDDDLSARVRVAVTPREVKPVVDQLNELLTRLESAFQRERTFSGDIAHELRTPLAGLRSTLEVTLARSRAELEYRETLAGSLAIVERVQNMVETLLYLGRLESGQVEIESQAVDLRDLVESVWRSLEEKARARRLSITWAVPEEVPVMADPVLLEMAVRNLLDNAVTYADEGGALRIELATAERETVLRIANTGSRVDQSQVAELLRRFTRADPSRKSAGDHFGLGLAITSKIAAALRCRMDIESSVGGEFRVTLCFRV